MSASDHNIVTVQGRKDNADFGYIRIGAYRFRAEQPVYDVPKTVADQLAADTSLVVEVERETNAEREKRIKKAEKAEEKAEADRAARRAAKLEAAGVATEQAEAEAEARTEADAEATAEAPEPADAASFGGSDPAAGQPLGAAAPDSEVDSHDNEQEG